MKKFIIAICGILIATNCLADDFANDYARNYRGTWGEKSNGDNGEILLDSNGGIFRIEQEREYENHGKIPTITMSAATVINDRGAQFCNMNLQYVHNKWKPWIDPSSCKWICVDGFYGENCASTNLSQCTTENLATNFNIDGDINAWSNKSIQTFYAPPSTDNISSVVEPLVIVAKKEHAVQVQAIGFQGNNSKITRALYKGEKIWLCAQGYRDTTGNGDCTIDEKCNGTCPDGYGLRSTDSLECVKCDDLHQGINAAGVCVPCANNEIFSKSANNCKQYKTYTKSDMRVHTTSKMKCWVETNKTQYERCVKTGN